MTTTTCLPRETLQRYLSGAIAEDETGDIEAHLSVCPACEQTVWQLEADPDTVLESMRELAAIESQEKSAPADSPSVIQRAIAAARLLPSPPTLLPAPLGKPAQIGAYELLQSLGRGGMGQVFLARHTNLDKQVAVKLLFPRPSHAGLDAENLISRFQREMRAAGRLNHPTIVSATDAGQENGTHYLVMEYIDGLDLSRLAKATGPLEIADACDLTRTVAQGLSHAHAEGIVHRDVKPSNLMLDRQGRVKILDFGLAQWNLLNESANELTTVGQLMGTLDYMAPEQAERNDGVDYRADLYALGATLFRLLTGRPPLAASPHMTLLEKVRLLGSQSAPSLSSLRSDAPAELVKLVASLLNRQITERPASAAHVAEALEPFCTGHDLASLFARAETIINREVTFLPENLASDRSSHASVAEPIAQLPPSPPSRRFPWLWAAAAVPLMILAGVVISLETQKGQLVIQSDVADIHVKLRRDNQTVQELTIQPGATTTRLYADRYEIVIDAPSDQVSLDKENLVVRSGQTIVANIKQLPSSQPPLQNSNVESTPPGLKAPAANVVASSVNDSPAILSMPFVTAEQAAGTKPLASVSAIAPVSAKVTLAGHTFEHWLKELDTDDREVRLQAMRAIEKLSTFIDIKPTLPRLVKLISDESTKAEDNYALWNLHQEPLIELAFKLLARCTEKEGSSAGYLSTQLSSNNNAWRRMILVHESIQSTRDAVEQARFGGSKYSADRPPSRALAKEEIALKAIDIVANSTDQDQLVVEAAADYLLPFAGGPLHKQSRMRGLTRYSDTQHPMTRDPITYLEASSQLGNMYWLSHNINLQTPSVQTAIIRRARETIANPQSSPEAVLLALMAFEYRPQPNLEQAIADRIALLLKDKDRLTAVYQIISRLTNGTQLVERLPGWNIDQEKLTLPFGNEFYLLVSYALAQNVRQESMPVLKDAIATAARTLNQSPDKEQQPFMVRSAGTIPGTALPASQLVQRDAKRNLAKEKLPADQLLLAALSAYAQWANSDEVQTSIAQHKVENAQVATKPEKPEPPPAVAESTSSSNIDDWLNMLAKATNTQDREKCLNSLLDTLDETYGPTATPKLLAAARTWDYEQAASANLLEQLRGRTPPAFSRPSPETLLLTCLSRCNTADRFLDVLCNEMLTGEDAWTARWMAGLVQYTQEGTYRGLHSEELLQRMLSTQFATGPLREFGPDPALLWQEYLRRELSSNRRWAQVYSQLAVKRIVEQRHLGPMSLLQMDPSRDLSRSGTPTGKLVLEEAIASYAKLLLVDRKSAPGYYAHAAFRLATTGPFVERWREELKPTIRHALQVLIKQDDTAVFGRLSDPPQRNLEWTSYEIPASVDAFLPPDNLPSPLRGLRYVNSETLGYLALIKRLELASEFDAELKALLERAIAGRQPLVAIAKQKHEWVVKLTWSGNRSALPAPWNDAPESAWNANFVYNAISALLSDIIDADSAALDLLVRHQTQMNMDRADTNDDGRLSSTEIETISGSRLPVDINQDGSWDFEELLADQLKSWKRYSRVPD